jgi:uncharacterized protein (DUF2249 family)
MNTIQQLDIRPVPPSQKHPLIVQTFDGLTAGETVQLINDHEPRPLFYQFQFERPGQFEWAYIEQGPTVWRVNITKVK